MKNKDRDILSKNEVDLIIRDYLMGGQLYVRYKDVDIEQLLIDQVDPEHIDELLFEHWSSIPSTEPTPEQLEILNKIKSSDNVTIVPLRKTFSKEILRYAAVVIFMIISVGLATYLYMDNQIQPAMIAVVRQETDSIIVDKVIPEVEMPMVAEVNNTPSPKQEMVQEVIEEFIMDIVEPVKQVEQIAELVVKEVDKIMTHQTQEGMTMDIVLSDGSHVTLYGGSKLSYKENFDKTVRVVNLEGKAYFTVSKDATRPMVVKIREMAVNVLGTEFAVDAYPDYPHTIITLTRGSVNIKTDQGNTHQIKVGEELSYNHQTKEVRIAKVKDKC